MTAPAFHLVWVSGPGICEPGPAQVVSVAFPRPAVESTVGIYTNKVLRGMGE